MNMMRAWLLKKQAPIETKPFSLGEIPPPIPLPGELLVRVKCCGICRTDLHIVEGELPLILNPTIVGHQVVGVVEQLGAGVRRFQVGEPIGIAWLWKSCGQCAYCRRKAENLCSNALFTGYHRPGGFALFTTVQEAFAYKLPSQGWSAEEMAPLLCAGIIGYRALKLSRVPQRGKIGLIGFGSSAHVVLPIAKARGYTVFVVSRSPLHRELAKSLGADWVGKSADELECSLDAIIIFAPSGELVPQALQKLDRGATLVVAGIYLSDIPTLNYKKHLFYEKRLVSVTANTRQDGEELLKEILRLPFRPRTQVYAFEDVHQALTDLKHDRIQGTGILRIQ